MRKDPFTLRVALSQAGSAQGELYLDDGVTFDHEVGSLVWRKFVAQTEGKTVILRSRDLAAANPPAAALSVYDAGNAFARSIKDVRVERVIVLGLSGKPSKVAIAGGGDLEWTFEPGVNAGGKKEGTASTLTIKDPRAGITTDWEIIINL